MENVTLPPREQTRLQVLNSLLAEHMTLDQAATLMGVSPRHTRTHPDRLPGEGCCCRCSRPPRLQGAQRDARSRCTAVVHLARIRHSEANHTHRPAGRTPNSTPKGPTPQLHRCQFGHPRANAEGRGQNGVYTPGEFCHSQLCMVPQGY